jgi:hypothetical protein
MARVGSDSRVDHCYCLRWQIIDKSLLAQSDLPPKRTVNPPANIAANGARWGQLLHSGLALVGFGLRRRSVHL